MSAIIHIGANKSASTTLQRNLFAKHPDLHYVGEDGAGYLQYKELMTSFLWTDDLFWNQSAAEDLFNQQKKMSEGKKFVFSSEDIMTSHIASQCLNRLRFLVGKADILLIVRNQLEAIISYYSSHGAYLRPAPLTHYKRFVPFNHWLEYNYSINEYGAIAGFDYWKFVNYCEQIFGEGRVKILMFEDLLAKPNSFYDDLAKILRIEPKSIAPFINSAHERKRHTWRRYYYNKGLSTLSFNRPISSVDQCAAIFGDRFESFLNSGKRISFDLSTDWQNRLSKRYEHGNLRLVEKFGLPLAKYGYPLPE